MLGRVLIWWVVFYLMYPPHDAAHAAVTWPWCVNLFTVCLASEALHFTSFSHWSHFPKERVQRLLDESKMLNILSSRLVVADRQASGHWAGAAPIRPSFDQTGTQAQLPWEACSWLFLSLCSRIMASENNRKIGAPPLWFDLPELKIACSALSQKVKDSRPRQIIQLTVSEKAEVWKVFLLPFF